MEGCINILHYDNSNKTKFYYGHVSRMDQERECLWLVADFGESIAGG